MPGRSLDQLGSLQKTVMETIWRLEEATVQQVLDALNRQKKPAYTTILSVMQKLEKMGWLMHRETGRTYIYRASRSREEEGQKALRKFTDRVFGSDPLLLFQHLLKDDTLSPEDLTGLRQMIDQQRKEREDG